MAHPQSRATRRCNSGEGELTFRRFEFCCRLDVCSHICKLYAKPHNNTHLKHPKALNTKVSGRAGCWQPGIDLTVAVQVLDLLCSRAACHMLGPLTPGDGIFKRLY